jgi:hypothetical protein
MKSGNRAGRRYGRREEGSGPERPTPRSDNYSTVGGGTVGGAVTRWRPRNG